jgi:hypothetical protein
MAMLSPLVSMAFFWASAFNARKLLGAAAAIHLLDGEPHAGGFSASASTASARPIMVRALSK